MVAQRYQCGWVILLGLALMAGCMSRKSAQAEARAAFLAGQNQALRDMQSRNQQVVRVEGQVRNPVVPWQEGITLARALLAADYSGLFDPRRISIIREHEAYPVNVSKFLRGEDDPELLAGDIIRLE